MLAMAWYYYVFLAAVLAAAANVAQRKILAHTSQHKIDPYAYTILFLLFGAVETYFYRQVTGTYSVPDVLIAPGNVVLNITLFAIATVATFEALKWLQVSHFTIISSLRPFVTLLTVFLVIGSAPTIYQVAGGLLIIGGILVVYLRRPLRTQHYKRGVYFALLATTFFGATLVNDKYLLEHFEVLDYLPFLYLLSGGVLLALKPKIYQKMGEVLQPRNAKAFLLSAVLLPTSTVLLMLGIQAAPNPANVSLLQQLQVVMVVLLGVFVLKEKDHIMHKLIAAALSIAGASLIVLAG